MIYFATPNTKQVRHAIATEPTLGAMLTPDSWASLNLAASSRFPRVALDNGCFSSKWEEGRWRQWLSGMAPMGGSVAFAVVPDVVADAATTAKQFATYADEVRSHGFPVAYAAQDGLDNDDLPWAEFDVIFVGGTTKYKLSEPAFALAGLAHEHGKWAHMGRVNSFQRLRRAAAAGFDSADGTYLRWPDTNLPKLQAWLRWIEIHPPLASV